MIQISCYQYQIDILSCWKSYTRKIIDIVSLAKKEKSKLIVLSEYSGNEIVCKKMETDKDIYLSIQPLIPKYIEFYKNLSKKENIYIQPGTIIEKISSDRYVNRAYFFQPSGHYGFQDKLFLTKYEKEEGLLQKGFGQTIFETTFGKIGIAICYDSEFPEIVRNLVKQGAFLILVPSYCTTLASFFRVYLSCRARAIENQCYIAVSQTVNTVQLTNEIEQTFGQSCILGPADIGFPENGILAQGKMNEVSMISAKISMEKIELCQDAWTGSKFF